MCIRDSTQAFAWGEVEDLLPLEGSLHERRPDVDRGAATGDQAVVLDGDRIVAFVLVDPDRSRELRGEAVEPDRFGVGRRAGLAGSRTTQRPGAGAGAFGHHLSLIHIS